MNTKKLFRCFHYLMKILIFTAIIFVLFTKFFLTNVELEIELSHIGIKNYPVAQNYERWDWNNYEFIKYERERTGNGEQGRGHQLTNPEEIEVNRKLNSEEGLFALVSDKISVNRSLWDPRLKL
jgi:hypothetical protein